jgi:hypothetical protein
MSDRQMESPSDRHWHDGRAGQTCILALLALCAAAALTFALWPASPASAQTSGQAPAPEAPASDIVAVAGQISPGTYGLYLVDQQRGSLAVYEYVPAEHMLHLRAARSIGYDLALESYNTQPSPAEVAKMVNQARRIPETSPAAR